MSKIATGVLLLAGVAAFVGYTAFAGDKGGDVPWNREPHKAMDLAKKARKGMMIYFTSDG